MGWGYVKYGNENDDIISTASTERVKKRKLFRKLTTTNGVKDLTTGGER